MCVPVHGLIKLLALLWNNIVVMNVGWNKNGYVSVMSRKTIWKACKIKSIAVSVRMEIICESVCYSNFVAVNTDATIHLYTCFAWFIKAIWGIYLSVIIIYWFNALVFEHQKI